MPIQTAAQALSQSIGHLSFRNRLMNGNFRIWQRGTDVTVSGYAADRWKGHSTNTNVANYSVRMQRVLDNPNPAGYCLSIAQSGNYPGINYLTLGQRIEASAFFDVPANSSMTVSFWIKRMQAADSNFSVNIRSPFTDVDSYQAVEILSQYDILVAKPYDVTFNSLPLNTWTKVVATFQVTNAMLQRGCEVFLENGPNDLNVSNTNELYRVTNFQLEMGNTETPFENRPYELELALCQRYYQNTKINGVEQFPYMMRQQSFQGRYCIAIAFPVTMRTDPSFEVLLSPDTSGGGNVVVGYPYSTRQCINADVVASLSTNYSWGVGYTASAEL